MPRVLTLLNASTATGAGTPYSVGLPGQSGPRGLYEGIVQATISSTTISVALEGSINTSTGPWVALETAWTADTMKVVALPRYVRGNVTAFTTGTATLRLMVPDGVQAST